jgi:hypothetical protein
MGGFPQPPHPHHRFHLSPNCRLDRIADLEKRPLSVPDRLFAGPERPLRQTVADSLARHHPRRNQQRSRWPEPPAASRSGCARRGMTVEGQQLAADNIVLDPVSGAVMDSGDT